MNDILVKLAQCVEFGKINKVSPYPPNMKDQDGADELARRALDEGVKPDEILDEALVPAMEKVGDKFNRKER
jgi:methanogenic corrinoid protein MtbC1